MDDRPVALVGMPGYGQVTGGAALGLFRASLSGRLDVRLEMRESSLLAHNFNLLWCHALNLARAGRLDYFAMIHADVEPEPGWLDVLAAELDRTGLDVLGVPCPIKDGRGLTSTALARDDGDPWRVHGRLTVAEVLALPETFTSADVGRPLLLNTGLWACRFDPAWGRKVRFEINDRIVVGPDGVYRAEVEPEDWFFSRLLHELGLGVGCTRKVRLAHRGSAQYPNDRAWGPHPYDAEYLTASAVPAGPAPTPGG